MQAGLISLLHALYVLWFVYTPFSDNLTLLMVHVVAAPAMMVHWALNNDTCVLTALEASLRGVRPEGTFIGRLVSPIYLLPSGSQCSWTWYGAATLLWLKAMRSLRREIDKLRGGVVHSSRRA